MKIKIFSLYFPRFFYGHVDPQSSLAYRKGTSSCTKSIGGRDIDTLMIISVAPWSLTA